ncbi:MAG: hypothetical protein R3322_00080 [Kiloniellales bacterium]|nr:hypothetical protein [Kiloniellales bacterium]
MTGRVLVCDVCGEQSTVFVRVTFKEMRVQMRQLGWRCGKDEDLCAACREKRGRAWSCGYCDTPGHNIRVCPEIQGRLTLFRSLVHKRALKAKAEVVTMDG